MRVVKVIRSGIGAITESDVILADASKAIVVGFNVVATPSAKEIAKDHEVEIRNYTIIYKLVEDIQALSAPIDANKSSNDTACFLFSFSLIIVLRFSAIFFASLHILESGSLLLARLQVGYKNVQHP